MKTVIRTTTVLALAAMLSGCSSNETSQNTHDEVTDRAAQAQADLDRTAREMQENATATVDNAAANATQAAESSIDKVVRASGLVIEDLKIGDGPVAYPMATVGVHYRGSLQNGEVFDKSDRDGEPVTFPLGRVIKGWQDGIPGMRVGGVRRLTIPSALAYGPNDIKDGSGKVIIPANSTLLFDVELMSAEGGATPTEQADGADAPQAASFTTPGGVKVERMTEGSGPACPSGATVTVHYRGTLINGEQFDSSYDRGAPARFPLARLIKGWQEGIPGMRAGEKRKLTVPSKLAYGSAERRDANGVVTIPADSTLIFEIELISFEP